MKVLWIISNSANWMTYLQILMRLMTSKPWLSRVPRSWPLQGGGSCRASCRLIGSLPFSLTGLSRWDDGLSKRIIEFRLAVSLSVGGWVKCLYLLRLQPLCAHRPTPKSAIRVASSSLCGMSNTIQMLPYFAKYNFRLVQTFQRWLQTVEAGDTCPPVKDPRPKPWRVCFDARKRCVTAIRKTNDGPWRAFERMTVCVWSTGCLTGWWKWFLNLLQALKRLPRPLPWYANTHSCSHATHACRVITSHSSNYSTKLQRTKKVRITCYVLDAVGASSSVCEFFSVFIVKSAVLKTSEEVSEEG